jgi:integrase/recombinase XerD
MTDEPISPLRRRMIDEMTIRHFSSKVQKDYLRHVKDFADFLGRSLAKAEFEDIRRYQVNLAERGVSPSSRNVAMTALRFFYARALNRPQVTDRIVFAREPKKLPVVLSPEEMGRLLAAAPTLKYQAALSVAYAGGLRISEVVSLKVGDIDSQRMVLRVEQGKGRKDRYVMLSPQLLELLRLYWKKYRPQGWLFPGQQPGQPLSTRQLNRACHAAVLMAGLDKPVSPHKLRHAFATHLLEGKTDIRVIQALLGHKKLDTTARYTQVAIKALGEVTSPLDSLLAEVKTPA